MALKIVNITMNTADPAGLAAWWTKALGGEVTRDLGDFVFAEAGGIGLGFQKTAEEPGRRAVLHLDLAADDRPAEVARLRELGARHVADHEVADFTWTVLADPDGNEFCVSEAH